MSEQEQDHMAFILAREQKDMEDSQQQPHNDGMDEVDSHDLSSRATAPASCRGRTCGSKIYVPCKNFHVPSYYL